jgi:hypothetical protein
MCYDYVDADDHRMFLYSLLHYINGAISRDIQILIARNNLTRVIREKSFIFLGSLLIERSRWAEPLAEPGGQAGAMGPPPNITAKKILGSI